MGKLGDYQLLEKLGEGGMGTVYKAIHAKLGRMVALKVLSKDRRWDQHAIARFDREMKAVGAVDHPNIVRATDAREVEGTRFLVMEYVDGLDLNALGRACHPIAIADVCEIVRQAALGLQDVHRHGLVHRDVKPSNLMVTPQGIVKLLDLGLARLEFDRPTDDEVTETGAALGTVDYMAPEQVSDSRSVDIRADIYSLGCTFYKLLSGRTPFAGPERRGLAERLAAHAREPVPPIRQFRGDVPPELVRILARMLEKDPNKRFSTPVEVADAVGPLATTGDLAALVARARRVAGGQAFLPVEGGQAFLPVAGAQAFLPVAGGQAVGPAVPDGAKSPAGKAGPTAVPLDAGEQAEQATAESRSPSSATRFFEQIVEGVGPAVPDTDKLAAGKAGPTAVPKWRKNIPVLISLGAMGVLCLAAVLIWAFLPGVGPAVPDADKLAAGTAGPTGVARPSCLVLQWPAGERTSAMLEINGQVQSLPDLALASSANEIRVPLKPGEHKVAVHRLGYTPFEQTFTLAETKDTVLRPVWKESGARGQGSGVGEVGQAKQPVGPALPNVAKTPAGEAGPTAVAKPEPPKPKPPEEDPVLKRRRELAARWNEAMGPAEAMIAAWDFAGAHKAIEKVRLDDPELAARLAARREELPKLAAFKERIIDRINGAKPPLKKFAIGLTGQDGDVLKADQDAITAKTSSRGIESHPWSKLSEKALPKVLQLAVQGGRESPSMSAKDGAAGAKSQPPTSKETPDPFVEDSLTAGMLSLAIGNPVQAEKHFEQARSLGANIDACLAPLAEAAFTRIEELLRRGHEFLGEKKLQEAAKEFQQADAALSKLESQYSQLPWFVSNKPAVTAAREAAKRGIHETEAENLYAEAVQLLNGKELFDLKPLVEKLKTEYAGTAAVTDGSRNPSFAELEKAVANLGKIITVRLDGQGDFTSVQSAIDAAPTNTVIQILDNGPYAEALAFPKEKKELTVRGRRGSWPLITSLGARKEIGILVSVPSGTQVSLDRLVLAHTSPAGATQRCISVELGGRAQLRLSILFMQGMEGVYVDGTASNFENCVIIASALLRTSSSVNLKNCLCLGARLAPDDAASLDATQCTIPSMVSLRSAPSSITDSIVRMSRYSSSSGHRVEFCNVISTEDANWGELGRGCLTADPLFRDAANLDFRLKPGSPCIGKASDGGDIGCRFTPEMLELCKVALDLRRRGILKF